MSDATAASFGTLDLDEGMIELIKPELAPGERLLWAARSNERTSRKRWHPLTVGAVWAIGLMTLSVLSFVGLSVYGLRSGAGEGLLVFVGLLSAIVGFIVAIGTVGSVISPSGKRRQVEKAVYAITDRRAILWSTNSKSDAIEVAMIPRGSINPESIRRIQYPDGSGDLLLHGYRPQSSFLGVAHVRHVEDLVRSHLVAPGPSPSNEF